MAKDCLVLNGIWEAEFCLDNHEPAKLLPNQERRFDAKLKVPGYWQEQGFSFHGTVIYRKKFLWRPEHLHYQGYANPNPAGDNDFINGAAALSWVGHWVWQPYSKALGDDLVLLPMPKFPKGQVTGMGSWCWAISVRCKQPASAWIMLDFLLQPEEIVKMTSANGAVPSRASAAALTNEFKAGGPLNIFVQQLKKIAVPRPVTPVYPILTNHFAEAIDNIMRGGVFLIGLIVALMVIPFEAIAMPLLLITNKFGWLDSYQVQIIPFIASPFYIFLFYQFFLRFPFEIEEAARIDGLGWYGIYWKMALPLAKPVLSSVAILHFLSQWGQFLWPVMTTRGDDYRPLTVAMQVYFGQYPRYWGDIMAFAAVMTIPVLVLFVFLQKFYVTSMARYGGK